MLFGASIVVKGVSDVKDFMGNCMSSFINMKFRKKGLVFEDFSGNGNGSSMSLSELIFCCLAIWKLFECMCIIIINFYYKVCSSVTYDSKLIFTIFYAWTFLRSYYIWFSSAYSHCSSIINSDVIICCYNLISFGVLHTQ